MSHQHDSRFLKSSAAYFIGSFLSKLALFFMLPLYTGTIPVGDMGTYDAVTALAVLVSSVLFFDVGVGLLRFSASDSEQRDRVLASGLFLILCLSVGYLVIGSVLFFGLDLPMAPFALLYGLLNALFAASGMVARAYGKANLYALAGVASTLVQIALNLILIFSVGLGVESLYISYAAGAAIGVVMLLGGCPMPRFSMLDLSVVRRLIRFCLPLGASAASYWVLTSFGRVAVTLWVGEASGGAFAISLKFAQIIVFASLAFRLAWQELAFAQGGLPDGAGENGRYYSERVDLFLRIMLAVCLVLVPLARVALSLFPNFIGADYAAAKPLIPLALVGAALTVFCDFLEPMFGAFEQTGKLLLTTALGAVLNITLTLAFLTWGGAFGAHLALILAMLFTVILRLVLLRRAACLRVRLRYVALLPLTALVVLSYLCFSPLVNVFVLISADLFGASLLLPELRWAIKEIKKAKA